MKKTHNCYFLFWHSNTLTSIWLPRCVCIFLHHIEKLESNNSHNHNNDINSKLKMGESFLLPTLAAFGIYRYPTLRWGIQKKSEAAHAPFHHKQIRILSHSRCTCTAHSLAHSHNTNMWVDMIFMTEQWDRRRRNVTELDVFRMSEKEKTTKRTKQKKNQRKIGSKKKFDT